MSYLSLKFLLLVCISILLYFIAPQKQRWLVLLAASLVFYAYNSKLLTIIVIVTSLVAFVFANLISNNIKRSKEELKLLTDKSEKKALKAKVKKKNRIVLVASTLVVLCVLLVMKYSGFFVGSLNSLITLFSKDFSISAPTFFLPLGISYYTLSLISYLVDVYRGSVEAERNYALFLLYTIYFPHIVEGPIGNYKQLAPQLKEGHKFNYNRFLKGFEIALYGLFKKMVLTDRLAIISNEVFDNVENYNGLPVIMAIIAYTVCIYADFSGCIDIVSGISFILGISLSENFRQPFFSKSIQEFWRRWHITLGAWLKSYIFYPMSLSKWVKSISQKISKFTKSDYYAVTLPMLIPLLFVWLANGFWHGANWKYVLYGLYYYIIIALGQLLEPIFKKILSFLKINRQGTVFSIFQILRTFILVCLGLTLFRCDSVHTMLQMLTSILKSSNYSELYGAINNYFSIMDYLVIAFAIGVIFFISVKKEKGTDITALLEEKEILRWIILTTGVLVVILFGVYGSFYTTQPFIYNQF